MAKTMCTVAVALLLSIGYSHVQANGDTNSKFTKHRHRRAAISESLQWEALNYTYYANPNVFTLKDMSVSHDGRITNNSDSDEHYAERLIGSPDIRRTLLKVGSGPFWVQGELFPTPSEPFSSLSVQAHILLREIPPYAGSIPVLFRVSDDNLFGSKPQSNGVQPCMRAVARYMDEEAEIACSPAADAEFCVARIPIPISWHERSRVGTVGNIAVGYSIFPATSLGSCEPNQGNSISHEDNSDRTASSTADLTDVGKVTLLSWEGNVNMVDQDRYLGLYVPSKRLGVGERFVIPVTINKMYLDGVCTVKAKARNGISAVAVRSTNEDEWNTMFMVKQKGTFAIVTVEGQGSPSDSLTTDSPADDPLVFVMEFEVLNDTTTSRIINWRVDCTMHGEAHASRFGTEIPVSDDWILTIVPMPKETSIANTALLTGREVSVTLNIGVVTHFGDVMDAADQARCRSPDMDVLKVRRSCGNVYLDGTETSGSESLTIQVSLQGHEASVSFSVWIPELPLRVELSDSKLSTIRGWKVASGRQDQGILEPEKMLNGDGDSGKKNLCQLRYQQASVSVYTRFYTPNPNSMSRPDSKRIYLFGDNLEQSVTHLVRNQITLEDRSIAKVEGTNIIAKSPGNTNVQIFHPRTKGILGEAPLAVAVDKVAITYMKVNLVSGMTLSVDEVMGQGSKVKSARVTALSDLFVEHQEAIMDASIVFNDGTRTSLHDVSLNDYTVSVATLDPLIALESPDSMQAYPGLIAMGEGSTTVMLSVALPEPCMKRRRSNAIIQDIITINVTYNNPKYAGLVRTEDTNTHPGGSQSLWRSLTKAPGAVDYGIVRLNLDVGYTSGKKDSSVISSIPIDTDFNNVFPIGGGRKPGEEDGEEVSTMAPDFAENGDEEEAGLSGIEVGMYVLLGVFSLAILAFMVNCIMFMAKYRRTKRVPKAHQGGAAYPQNWVLLNMQEGHPRILTDPAESIPLRMKDDPDQEGSSRDEAIGTESEVSIERHADEDCALMQAPRDNRDSNNSQETDCGVVMDCDENEDGSLQELENNCQNVEELNKEEEESMSASSENDTDTEAAVVRTVPDETGQVDRAQTLPTPNTNQSNNSCDVRITLNPSNENLYLKSGLEGMEFNQILNYLDNLKESCT